MIILNCFELRKEYTSWKKDKLTNYIQQMNKEITKNNPSKKHVIQQILLVKLELNPDVEDMINSLVTSLYHTRNVSRFIELNLLHDPLTKKQLTTELRNLKIHFRRSASKPILKKLLINHHVESIGETYLQLLNKVSTFTEVLLSY